MTTYSITILSRVDAHHRLEKFNGLGFGTLEGIAADDRAKASTFANGTGFFKHIRVSAFGSSRENHDTSTIKRTLHDMANTLRKGLNRHLLAFIDLLGRRLSR